MKSLLGLLLIIGGVCLGLYVGLYLCFICGIIDIIKEIRAPEMSSSTVAWDIVRIMFAGVAGYVAAFLLIIPGIALYGKR